LLHQGPDENIDVPLEGFIKGAWWSWRQLSQTETYLSPTARPGWGGAMFSAQMGH